MRMPGTLRSTPSLSATTVLSFMLLLTVTAGPVRSEPAPVAVAAPEQRAAVATLELTGTLVAARRANLSTRVAGLVANLQVDIGDHVKAGDVLLSLDRALEVERQREREADVAARRANLREQQRLVDEAERLVQEKHLPANELALRKAHLDIARAELSGAEAAYAAQLQNLRWHTLTAPFDGIIHRRLTEQGEWVTTGTTVLELVAMAPVYLDVQVPQERYQDIVPGDKVTLHPDALPGQAIPGEVTRVVPVSDPLSRSFRVRIRAIDSQAPLLPGTSARAAFTLNNAQKQALLIPRDAVLRNPDGQFSAFVVSQSSSPPVAERRQITLGQQVGTQVEVVSGLSLSDTIVVRGNEILRHGQSVTIKP